MKKYVITGPARADLREIWNYIALQSERHADRLLDEVHARFEDLADQPLLMGFADSVYGTEYRISPVRDYIVFYVLAVDRIEIVRVIHGARDIESLSPF